MIDLCWTCHVHPCRCAGTTTASRDLTPNELTSLEKISALRGFAGRQRAAIRNALDLLRPEDPAACVLRDALGEKAP